MGISKIEYRGKQFSASDSVLEVWLKLLVDEFDKLETAPEWLREMRDDWFVQATEQFGYGMMLGLDDWLSQPNHRDLVLQAARRALMRLRSFGDPIPAPTLNAVGAGKPESPFPRDLPAENFIEPAEDFIDLLEDDEVLVHESTPITTQEQLLQAIYAHTKWLVDPTTGRRLKLKDAQLAGANLSGTSLTRAMMTGVDLRGANLENAKLLRSELENVNFEGANLVGADLQKVRMRGCNFDRITAEGVKIGRSLTEDSSFKHARLNHSTITRSTFLRVSMTGAKLTNSVLHCTLDGDLRGCEFSGSDLRSAAFRNADLRDCNFTETVLVKTSFVRVRLSGVYGTPFVANNIGASEIDFSATGDGGIQGTAFTLRERLGGASGPGAWGTATLPEHYVAFQVDDGDTRYFTIERRSGSVEVLRVLHCAVQKKRLVVHYRILDHRLDDDITHDLIFQVLLLGLLNDRFRGSADKIDYINVETKVEVSTPYA